MSCGFSEYELYIIWKICYRNRWCPKKHIAKRDLVKGRPIHEIDKYEAAIENLVKKQFLHPYYSQGRTDVCMPKQNRNKAQEALEAHKNQYTFIRNLEFIR